MAILKMKKIRLCGIAEEQDQLIRELQLLGSVEIGSPEALTEAQQTQLFRTADGAGADALSQTSAALASALETLKHYETKKGGMFSARPEKTLGELFDDDAYRAAVQTAQEALDTQDARSRNQAEKSRLTALRESSRLRLYPQARQSPRCRTRRSSGTRRTTEPFRSRTPAGSGKTE